MKIAEFCEKHNACSAGQKWAQSLGIEDMDEVWRREDMKPEWRRWIATRDGVLTNRELRLFACFCARQNWHLLSDERSRNAVDVAERYANGLATDVELSTAARASSASAASAYTDYAAYAAYAADYAAYAAYAAASAAYAAYAASRAADYASRAADSASSAAASSAAQSQWLAENTNPSFGGHNATT